VFILTDASETKVHVRHPQGKKKAEFCMSTRGGYLLSKSTQSGSGKGITVGKAAAKGTATSEGASIQRDREREVSLGERGGTGTDDRLRRKAAGRKIPVPRREGDWTVNSEGGREGKGSDH